MDLDAEREAEEPDENGLTPSEYAQMAAQIESLAVMAWRAVRGRLTAAIARGDYSGLAGAVDPELRPELEAHLRQLPLIEIDEAPAVQIVAVDLVDEEYVLRLREVERSELAALLGLEGVLEIALALAESQMWRLVAYDSADEPHPSARVHELELSVAALLPDDFVPPRYRAEPAFGEGLWLAKAELDSVLAFAEDCSRDGTRYLVFDREGLERRGHLIASFENGQRL
jgi:hypothetical protein